MTVEDWQLLRRYGVWLLVGRCSPTEKTPEEVLGRLLAMLFHWFHVTEYSLEGQEDNPLEKLKTEYVCDWLRNLSKSHYKLFISCLLPHPPEYARIGGHWVSREDVWQSLERRGLEKGMIEMIKALYKSNKNKVRTSNAESAEFESQIGLKQGCVLSPLLFSILIDDAVKKAKQKGKNMKVGNWKMNAINVQELMFADHMVLIAHSEETLQQNLKIYQEELTKINTRKTNTMIIAAEERKNSIKIGEKALEQLLRNNH
ncbi:hypothetical protein Trydic_g10685 [Trypoxylus dichotomus]